MVSDARKKKDIVPLNPDRCMDIVRGADVHTFSFKDSDKTRIGLIAQQLNEVCPEAVGDDGDMLAIDWGQVVSVVFGALKNIDDRLKRLESNDASGSPRV